MALGTDHRSASESRAISPPTSIFSHSIMTRLLIPISVVSPEPSHNNPMTLSSPLPSSPMPKSSILMSNDHDNTICEARSDRHDQAFRVTTLSPMVNHMNSTHLDKSPLSWIHDKCEQMTRSFPPQPIQSLSVSAIPCVNMPSSSSPQGSPSLSSHTSGSSTPLSLHPSRSSLFPVLSNQPVLRPNDEYHTENGFEAGSTLASWAVSDALCDDEENDMDFSFDPTTNTSQHASVTDKDDSPPSAATRAAINGPPVHVPTTKFSDIVGQTHAKLHLKEIILPFSLPPEINRLVWKGPRAMPASVLLYGPPGCGKTQLARAVAGEIQAHYCVIHPSDLWSKYVGDSEAAIRKAFVTAAEQARQVPSQCAVIFLDEIDSMGQTRGNSSDESSGCSRRVLAELLMILSDLTDQQHEIIPSTFRNELSTFDRNNRKQQLIDSPGRHSVRFLVLAATNRLEDLDPALKRRFAVQLPIFPPNLRDRKKLLQRNLTGVADEITPEAWEELASWLDGWTGSGLCSLVREASMAPVRECIRSAVLVRKKSARTALPEMDRVVERIRVPIDIEQEYLVNELQNLRPVVLADFVHAIQTMQPSFVDDSSHDLTSTLHGTSPSMDNAYAESCSDDDDL